MKTFCKTIAGICLSLVVLLSVAGAVYADGTTPTPTRTPTPTVTPKPETRVECTTGAYGQQTCKTVVVAKEASPEGRPKHEVVNSGIQENIIMALVAVFILSGFGYTYSKGYIK